MNILSNIGSAAGWTVSKAWDTACLAKDVTMAPLTCASQLCNDGVVGTVKRVTGIADFESIPEVRKKRGGTEDLGNGAKVVVANQVKRSDEDLIVAGRFATGAAKATALAVTAIGGTIAGVEKVTGMDFPEEGIMAIPHGVFDRVTTVGGHLANYYKRFYVDAHFGDKSYVQYYKNGAGDLYQFGKETALGMGQAGLDYLSGAGDCAVTNPAFAATVGIGAGLVAWGANDVRTMNLAGTDAEKLKTLAKASGKTVVGVATPMVGYASLCCSEVKEGAMAALAAPVTDALGYAASNLGGAATWIAGTVMEHSGVSSAIVSTALGISAYQDIAQMNNAAPLATKAKTVAMATAKVTAAVALQYYVWMSGGESESTEPIRRAVYIERRQETPEYQKYSQEAYSNYRKAYDKICDDYDNAMGKAPPRFG